MKQTSTRLLTVLILTAFYLAGNAQTIVNITTNTNSSIYGSGVFCTNCIINISPGVTLTFNSSCGCNTCTFSGGTVAFIAGSSFSLMGVDSFKKETVLIGQSFSTTAGVTFYGDSVAFNTPMSISNGKTTIDSSRVSVNSALTLNVATLNMDSLHLNSNLNLNNATDTFSNSNVDVATGVAITTQQTLFNNSTFAFTGTSNMNVNNSMTSTGSSFYLDSTAYIKSGGTTTMTGGNLVMTAANTFTASNALPLTNVNVIMDSTSTLFAASLTATGGSIDDSNSAKITVSNAATFSGTAVTLNDNTNLTAASLAATNGSLTMDSASRISSSNAVTFSGTVVAMNNKSVMVAASASLASGASLGMNNTAFFSVTNGLTVSASNVVMGGNSFIADNSTTIENDSYFRIGDYNATNSAHLLTPNGLSILDNSLLGITNNDDYLHTSASSYATGTGSTSVSISGNSISCGGGAPENACASGTVFGCATLNMSGAVGCTVLALASIDLAAVKAGPDDVALSWSDIQSATADYYLVERNAGNNDWITLATVNAGGYTPGNYRFDDQAAPAGTDDYRIARVDKEGNTLYSSVSSVTITSTANSIGIYPNPVTGHTFFITVPNTGQLMVNVYTLTGQLLMRTTLQGQMQYPVQLPSKLLPGTAVVIETISTWGRLSFPLLLR